LAGIEDLVRATAALRDAHEHVAVLPIPPSVAMEVEAPTLVIVGVPLAPHGDGVGIATGKGDPQGDANLPVDEEIVPLGARDILNAQPHTTQFGGDSGPGSVVFGLAVHRDS
jgi:hypothetical protein